MPIAEFRVVAEGVERTVAALMDLEQRTRKKVLRKAVRAGGAVIVKAAKKHAPRSTGLFKRSITQKVKSYTSGNVLAIVGQKRGAKITARKKVRQGRGGISGRGEVVPIHFVENPIQQHEIARQEARALRLGNDIYAYSILHPGTRGSGFMARTYGEVKITAREAFYRKAEFEIDREAAAVEARFTRYG